MTAGRKPKPTEQKKLAGNPGKRALNDAEPAYKTADPRVPKGKLPKEAQELWRALAGHMAELGVLKVTDLPALEMLCLHYAVARAALAQMLTDGRVEVENEQGERFVVSEGIAVTIDSAVGLKKHPAATVLKENSLAFKAYLTEFGLTPSSRVRIKVEGGEKEPSLAELLFDGVDA
jgi:P27 family predicted phage terminase small subunit